MYTIKKSLNFLMNYINYIFRLLFIKINYNYRLQEIRKYNLRISLTIYNL